MSMPSIFPRWRCATPVITLLAIGLPLISALCLDVPVAFAHSLAAGDDRSHADQCISTTSLSGLGPDHMLIEADRGTFASELPLGPALIHLGAGYTLDPASADPEQFVPAELRGTAPSADERGYFLVQFAGPINVQDRNLIESAGGLIVNYVPDYAFLVSLTGAAHERVAQAARVAWTALYQPAYKISTLPQMNEPGRGDRVVLLFPDASMAEVQQRVAQAGGEILEVSDNGINKILKVALDRADIAGVAHIPEVAWIEPFQIPEWHNNQCQWVVQTWDLNNRRLWDLGLHGEGQIASVADTGIRVTHNQFFDALVPIITFGDYPDHRKVIAYKKTVATISIGFGDESHNSYHGTHTSATTAGNDEPNGGDDRDGIAKEAKIYFLDGGGYPDPGVFIPLDLNDMFIMPYEGNDAGAARIMTNSWGNPTGGAYDLMSMTSDQFMWNHPEFLIFFSNGNSAGSNTVGSPATAKNVVSAGGTRNGSDADLIYNMTSRGPTDDGRLKPTICAPAGLSSAHGAGDTGYALYWGTSMASPAMAGATVLMRQYLTDGWYPTGAEVPGNAIENSSAALLKAMAINSASPDVQNYTVPDNNIGWGRILDDDVCYFAGDQRKLALIDNTEGLLTGEYVEYQVFVADPTIPLKAAVVWSDYPGSPAVSIQLVNDLNLSATDGLNTYLGNVYSGGQSIPGGSADELNVEECVRRDNPSTGLWTFRIEGANVPLGPQPFALVISGGLGADAATVKLDRATYGGNDQIEIQVIDLDAGSSVTVDLASDTDWGGETLELTGGDGVYAGTFPLTLDCAWPGDNLLSVSDGDQVTVTYTDANPPVTLTATALVNISGPAISDVHAETITEAEITIAWNTTTPANAKVYYGATPALGSETDVTPNLLSTQAVVLPDLLPNTLIYYDVESFDNQQNGIRDDNGGFHYTVSTDFNRDVLLVIGDATFDKNDRYHSALGQSGWTYTLWEGNQAATPYVGDLGAGMASYKAVVWQTGLEQYPMFTDAARDSISRLNDLGSRLAVISHDVAWDFSDGTSPDWSQERQDWFEDELKSIWLEDPLMWLVIRGIDGDPISGDYTSGISYTPHREGAAGDGVAGNPEAGTFAYVWRNILNDDIAIRWTGDTPVGDPELAVWGGTPRKVSGNYFEWAHINVGIDDDPIRADILDKTLIWLIGHDHPSAAVVAPNGGESFSDNSISISWTEQVDSGFSIASRKIYYSDNSGDQWSLITDTAGPSPHSWDISAIPNGAQYQVRIVLEDDADPALLAADSSDEDFAITRPGGDTRGPVILAGSIASDPNPILVPYPMTLTATVSDLYTGNSDIAEAEWSMGETPAPAGSGTPMSGSFDAPVVDVSAVIDTGALTAGTETFWVRGRDAAGEWSNASSLTVQVNWIDPQSVEDILPVRFALYASSPNPFGAQTMIRFDLPHATEVSLAVFDVSGRRVCTLADRRMEPGQIALSWDGRDGGGRGVGSGIYFYRLRAGEFEAVRKLTLLK